MIETFSDMAEYAKKCATEEELKVMHLWLPQSATPEQIKLVNAIIGDDTGRDCKDTG